MEKPTLSAEERADLWANRWVPWMFVLAFLVVGAVNAVFVYLAIHSHTGLVTEQAYEKGLAFNQTLAKAEAMQALGWNFSVELTSEDILSVRLVDKSGNPIQKAQVKGRMVRPVKSGYDYEINLAEQMKVGESGVYQVLLRPPLRGSWTVHLVATQNGQSFEKSEALVLK
ncbi:MAG: FixH family protein [Alphaproteobacteria bacterium]|jgi:nitrogen fixation protein FixH|nr:FixH family protein [Alphaproteobacteria bacterium]